MKKLIAFYAITGLLAEAAAEDRMERIDLAGFSCKQFLEMNRDDALIVVGSLQGYYLDEHVRWAGSRRYRDRRARHT